VEAGRGEENTREDAVKRGEAVIKSKMTEHLIPFLPEFRYNLQDAKFIGFSWKPCRLRWFKRRTPEEIVFVGVKTVYID
jgi:predicted Holliday junction resolvase-like endonuclease